MQFLIFTIFAVGNIPWNFNLLRHCFCIENYYNSGFKLQEKFHRYVYSQTIHGQILFCRSQTDLLFLFYLAKYIRTNFITIMITLNGKYSFKMTWVDCIYVLIFLISIRKCFISSTVKQLLFFEHLFLQNLWEWKKGIMSINFSKIQVS